MVVSAFLRRREPPAFVIMKFILGKKLGMTRFFNEEGEALPVTLVEAGPCTVTQVKSGEGDGYSAVQLGFSKKSKLKKPQKDKPFYYLKEFRGSFDKKAGEEITADVFAPGDKVKVSGVSKGKGFAGVVKKWGFKGAATSTHGTKHNNRRPGSIGSMFPQRVFKGKKMAGRMGSNRVSVKNLEIVHVDTENNTVALKGAVPGKKGGLLIIKEA